MTLTMTLALTYRRGLLGEVELLGPSVLELAHAKQHHEKADPVAMAVVVVSLVVGGAYEETRGNFSRRPYYNPRAPRRAAGVAGGIAVGGGGAEQAPSLTNTGIYGTSTRSDLIPYEASYSTALGTLRLRHTSSTCMYALSALLFTCCCGAQRHPTGQTKRQKGETSHFVVGGCYIRKPDDARQTSRKTRVAVFPRRPTHGAGTVPQSFLVRVLSQASGENHQ